MSDQVSRKRTSGKKVATKKVAAKKRAPAKKKVVKKSTAKKAAAKKTTRRKAAATERPAVTSSAKGTTENPKLHQKLASVEAFHNGTGVSSASDKQPVPIKMAFVKRTPSAVTVHTFMSNAARIAGIFFVLLGALSAVHYTNLALAEPGAENHRFLAAVFQFNGVADPVNITSQYEYDEPERARMYDEVSDLGHPPEVRYEFEVTTIEVDDFGNLEVRVEAAGVKKVLVTVRDQSQRSLLSNVAMKPKSAQRYEHKADVKDWSVGTYDVTFTITTEDSETKTERDALRIDSTDWIAQYRLQVPFVNLTFKEFFTAAKARGHCAEFLALNPELKATCSWDGDRFMNYRGNGAAESKVFSLPVDWLKVPVGTDIPVPPQAPAASGAPGGEVAPADTATGEVDPAVDDSDNTSVAADDSVIKTGDSPDTIAIEEDTTPEEQTDVVTTEETDDIPESLPVVELDVKANEILRGFATIVAETEYVTGLDFFVTDRNGLTPKSVGRATSIGPNKWLFSFNTRNTPNGNYQLLAKANSPFGRFEATPVNIRIRNTEVPTPTAPQVEKITKITDVAADLSTEVPTLTGVAPSTPPITDPAPAPSQTSNSSNAGVTNSESSPSPTPLTTPGDTEGVTEVADEPADDEVTAQLRTIVELNQSDVDKELQRLAVAVRQGDAEAVERIKKRIADTIGSVADDTLDVADEELTEKVASKVDTIVNEFKGRVEKTDQLITERAATDVLADSDNDGITDFDEVSIFNTDPFVADSDNDGFVDGAEVLSGFDPLDDTRETLIVYESPKQSGVVREDVFKVKRIQTVASLQRPDAQKDEAAETPEASSDSTDTDDVLTAAEADRLQAVIEGTALPNSFVTIYIFSTPIIVTVKTDADGSWRYEFDHELEDGTHDVYVGITDNAGRIVAKSEPFQFVKRAQAVETLEAATITAGTVATGDAGDRTNTYLLYAIVALSVVAVGLVLILLGADLRRRRPEPLMAAPSV